MKIPAEIQSLLPVIVQDTQRQYDKWQQDEDGNDETVGSGGICHLIADKIIDRVGAAGITCTTVSSHHEVHVYTVLRLPRSSASPGVWSIDIRPYVYETGGGYTWKKIPDVVFDESDVQVERLSPDPRDFKDYVEEWGEDEEDEDDDDDYSRRMNPRDNPIRIGKAAARAASVGADRKVKVTVKMLRTKDERDAIHAIGTALFSAADDRLKHWLTIHDREVLGAIERALEVGEAVPAPATTTPGSLVDPPDKGARIEVPISSTQTATGVVIDVTHHPHGNWIVTVERDDVPGKYVMFAKVDKVPWSYV